MKTIEYKIVKPQPTVFDLDTLFRDYRDHHSMAASTAHEYKQTIKRLKKFLVEELGTDNPILEDFDVRLLTRYSVDMQKRGLAFNYRNRMIKEIKAIFRYARRMKFIPEYPFEDYTSPKERIMEHSIDQLDRRLSKEQLGVIENTPIGNKKMLERTRLLFLFQRWTGMSWTDLNHYGVRIKECLRTDLQGRSVVQYNRVKTGETAIIPLFNATKELLVKLEYDVSPGLYDTYHHRINEMFDYLEIPKEKIKVGAHLARHVFGSEMLELGFTMEAVSRMMGHASIKETESTYARINAEKIFADASRVKAIQDVFQMIPEVKQLIPTDNESK